MKGDCLRFFLLGALVLFGLYLISPYGNSDDPRRAVEQYVRALYARDYGRVYGLLSPSDQVVKPRATYLLENEPARGISLALSRVLSSAIEFQWLDIATDGNGAKVHARMKFPDGNSPPVTALLQSAGDFERLSPLQEREILLRLRRMAKGGQVPRIGGEERFRLSRTQGAWRIVLGWEVAPIVEFVGEVKNGLPWTFRPLESKVRAFPGETLRNFYRVKNNGDKEISAKALHVVMPEIAKDHLEILQCFCLIRETLESGEEKQLPLIYRLRDSLPSGVKYVEVRYLFYPVDSFKAEWEETGEPSERDRYGSKLSLLQISRRSAKSSSPEWQKTFLLFLNSSTIAFQEPFSEWTRRLMETVLS